MPRMWADVVFGAEQRHALTLAIWGALALVCGAGTAALARKRSASAGLLLHFGVQMALWGAAELVVAGVRGRALALADQSHAIGLERWAWFTVGLETGLLLAAATLAVAGWVFGRRLSAVGAGTAIAAHAMVLIAIDVQLIRMLV